MPSPELPRGATGNAKIPGGIWGWRPAFPGSSGAGSAESRTAILAPAPTPAPEMGGSARLWVCAKPWSKSASGVALVRNKAAAGAGVGRSQTHSVGSLLICGRQLQAYPPPKDTNVWTWVYTGAPQTGEIMCGERVLRKPSDDPKRMEELPDSAGSGFKEMIQK